MTNKRASAFRAAAAIVGTLILSACGAARYPAYYLLHFEPSPQVPASARGIGTLTVKELRCPDYLCEGRLVYRPTPTEVGFYQYHRWAVSPGAMIAHHVAERLRARSLFTSVSTDAPLTATDFVLSSTLEQFEEVDQDRRVAAVCTIAAQVVDTRTRSVVWHATATERVSVENHDAAGVVNGLEEAVRASVDRLVDDMERELGHAPAAQFTPTLKGGAGSALSR